MTDATRRSLFPHVAGASTVVVGGAVLVGWALGSQLLTTVLSGTASMKPNTALCFILLGAGVLLRGVGVPGARSAKGAAMLAGLVVAVGIATLIEYVFGVDLRLDTVLFAEPSATFITPHVGRMGANTALAFVLLGSALAAFPFPRLAALVEPAVVATLALAGAALIGYSLGAVPTTAFAVTMSQMAIHTAALFVLLGGVVLWEVPGSRVRRILTSDGPGGLAARRLLPLVYLTLLGLGWLRLEGERRGHYGLGLGVSLMVFSALVVLTVGVVWAAAVIDRLHFARRVAEDARRDFESRLKAVEEAAALKKGFVAHISHELRTPLNAILGFSELMQDGKAGPMTPRQDEYMAQVLASSHHLLSLIDGILDLASLDAAKVSFHNERISLPAVVAEVLNIVTVLAEGKQIRMEVGLAPELSDVDLDPERLKQVLFNYVSNAIKFTPRGGRIVVRALPEQQQFLRLEVEDNGIGIRAEDCAELFQEFHRVADPTGVKQEGTGLGLALTRRIVEAQGGSVGVRSERGKGSVFFALLPRSPEVLTVH